MKISHRFWSFFVLEGKNVRKIRIDNDLYQEAKIKQNLTITEVDKMGIKMEIGPRFNYDIIHTLEIIYKDFADWFTSKVSFQLKNQC